jgi:hypothetical protein
MTAWGFCQRAADDALRAEWVDVRAAASVKAGSRAAVRVTLRNGGAQIWRANACGVSFVSRWLEGERPATPADARSPLLHPVSPGETIVADIAISAPSAEGQYTLEIDLQRERSSQPTPWVAALRIPIRVTGG